MRWRAREMGPDLGGMRGPESRRRWVPMRKIPTRREIAVVTTLAIMNGALGVAAAATSTVNDLDEVTRYYFFLSAAFGIVTLFGVARGHRIRSRFIAHSIYDAEHLAYATRLWRMGEAAIDLIELAEDRESVARRRDVLVASGEFDIAHKIDRLLSDSRGIPRPRRRRFRPKESR